MSSYNLSFHFLRRKISSKTLMLFTRQLAVLMNAGIPLSKSLELIHAQASDPLLKTTLSHIQKSLHDGYSLSKALAKYPAIFNIFYTTMIQAGELGGTLGSILNRLVTLQEKEAKIKNKFVSILLYPSIILLMTCIILILLWLFVIPRFETIFTEAFEGQTLPWYTQLLLDMSHLNPRYFLMIFIGLSLFFILGKLIHNTKQGALFFDRFLLATPLLGTLIKKEALIHFSNTLGMLLMNGVPILDALLLTQKLSKNRMITQTLLSLYEHVREGETFLLPMKASSLFSPMMISMISIGEETGQLAEMLLHVGTAYESEVEERINQCITVIEPLMILFLAIFVGSIIIALFLPLISLMSGVQTA